MGYWNKVKKIDAHVHVMSEEKKAGIDKELWRNFFMVKGK